MLLCWIEEHENIFQGRALSFFSSQLENFNKLFNQEPKRAQLAQDIFFAD